jgi:hypothetical protein
MKNESQQSIEAQERGDVPLGQLLDPALALGDMPHIDLASQCKGR